MVVKKNGRIEVVISAIVQEAKMKFIIYTVPKQEHKNENQNAPLLNVIKL